MHFSAIIQKLGEHLFPFTYKKKSGLKMHRIQQLLLIAATSWTYQCVHISNVTFVEWFLLFSGKPWNKTKPEKPGLSRDQDGTLQMDSRNVWSHSSSASQDLRRFDPHIARPILMGRGGRRPATTSYHLTFSCPIMASRLLSFRKPNIEIGFG